MTKQIEANVIPDSAKKQIIEWKIEADAENPQSDKKELIAIFGEGKWKLSSLEKHDIKSNENACLQGRFTNTTGAKFTFEFYMSPNQKNYMGKMWPEGSKTKQPLTIWHCMRD